MAPLIAPDANLLIFAYDSKSRFHSASKLWWEQAMQDGQIGLPLQSVLAFLRITTNLNYRGLRFSSGDAIQVADSWLIRPNVRLLMPSPSHWGIFRRLILEAGAGANLTTDAHMAALAIEHDATFYTADADFARFPGLRWMNPLVALA
jgi:toxin-antitoxin system PIN domain toxin